MNESSGIPVYLQLREQVLHAISTGQLHEGDQLPTVREVGVELAINPNTVNRAYAELERDGVLTSRRGIGTFIAHAGASSPAPQRDRLLDICRRALAECQAFGFTADDLIGGVKRTASARRDVRKSHKRQVTEA